MSSLQQQITNHQSIISQYNANNIENQIQPLLHFVLILCSNKNYKGADEILSHLIESPSFEKYKKLSSIWILRSQIAEEMGDLQKAAQIFDRAIRASPQPIQSLLTAFSHFSSRHNKPSSKQQATANNNAQISKKNVPKPKQSNFQNVTKIISATPKPNFAPSPMSKIGLSPIVSKRVPCTPICDSLELAMFESEKHSQKLQKRQKKFHFRSRQNKQNQAMISTKHQNNTNMIMPSYKTNLSPIEDMTETISFNGSSITPNQSNSNDMDCSMNMSAISDMSSIEDITRDFLLLSPIKKLKSPELPPKNHSVSASMVPITPLTALQSKPLRFSPPISALKAKAPQRRNINGEVLGITDKMNVCSLKKKMAKKESLFHGAEKEENEKENQNGSFLQMKVIPMSPTKAKKYGSDKVLSPVRRSARLQRKNISNCSKNERNDTTKNVQQLLKESNYTFLPNPMLPKDLR